MKNKTLLIVLVLVVAGLLLYGYNVFFGPETVAGEKEVTLRVIIDHQDIDKTFTYHTDHELLSDLIKENEAEMGVTLKNTDFGTMITGMMDYAAEDGKKEFFHISINGNDAETGVDQIAVNDQDAYTFELKTW